MINPSRCARINFRAACDTLKAPFKFTSIIVLHVSSVISRHRRLGMFSPALLTRIFIQSCRLTIPSATRPTASTSAISSGSTSAMPPALEIRAATSSNCGTRRPDRMTVAPAPASAIAPARPIPVPAPVTHAIFPSIDCIPFSRNS